MTAINRDEWLTALAAAEIPLEDEQAAVSVLEFAEMMGLARQASKKRLEELVARGLARQTHKWSTCNGRRAHVKAYVLVKA
jgi:predicted ArsR family transcriptional regulator